MDFSKFSLIIPKDWGDDTFEKIKKVFDDKYKLGLLEGYAWAEHEPDLGHNFHHYHIGGFMLHINNKRIKIPLSDIMEWFSDFPKILENSIQQIWCSEDTYCTYLLHLTDRAKQEGKLPPISKGGTINFELCVKNYTKKGIKMREKEQKKNDEEMFMYYNCVSVTDRNSTGISKN